jgi:hypothetical protein
MFYGCVLLYSIDNLGYLGNLNSVSNLTTLTGSKFLAGTYILYQALSNLHLNGVSVNDKLALTSIVLSNANSTFSGTSPHINVSYTNLSIAAINALFNSLPVLTSKTINITGCTGAAGCTRSKATSKGWTVTG